MLSKLLLPAHSTLLLFICIFSGSKAYMIVRSMKNNNHKHPFRPAQDRCTSNIFTTTNNSNDNNNAQSDISTPSEQKEDDTIRVRIWRALSTGEEMSLSKLSAAISISSKSITTPLSQSDLRYHLKHVERQARTISNKSIEWRKRRGLIPTNNNSLDNNDNGNGNDNIKKNHNKLRMHFRRDKKKRNQLYVRIK